jgi:hypothetical protein
LICGISVILHLKGRNTKIILCLFEKMKYYLFFAPNFLKTIKQNNMKKRTTAVMLASAFFTLALWSCGEKFTPLTEEQINAKVDSAYNAIAEAKKAEFKAACEADKAAKVAAKVAEMQNAAQQVQ